MQYRTAFDEYEKIVVYDELAQFLGVNGDGLIEFSYIDIVKSEGHSCATVAGAYLAALKGLSALCPEGYPKRGEIKVELKGLPREENSGVTGSVLSIITGASIDSGFGGIPTGKFNRRDTLFFGVLMDEDIRLTRLDTGKVIGINYRPSKVANPMSILMSAIGPEATLDDKETFSERFQEMVHLIFQNKDEVIELINL